MPRLSFAAPSLCFPVPPCLPPTARDLDVPPLFRRRFILGGYRPVGQPWRIYLLSLFQMHNETLSVWGPLLAAVTVALRFMMFAVLGGGGLLGFRLRGPDGQGLSVDVDSLPLVFHASSAVSHLSCSAAARLFHPLSEDAHHLLLLLENVGGAIYLYCSALALYLYSSDSVWTQSMLGKIFLPAVAFLCWTSCATSCCGRVCPRWTIPRKLRSLAVITVISPIAHRLSTHSWTTTPASYLHLLQVVLSLLSVFFFSCSSPECFSPGSFDILCHSRQLRLVLLSLQSVVQQEALFLNFLWRRPALLRLFGEERLLLACSSVCWLTFCCGAAALALRRRVQTAEEVSPQFHGAYLCSRSRDKPVGLSGCGPQGPDYQDLMVAGGS